LAAFLIPALFFSDSCRNSHTCKAIEQLSDKSLGGKKLKGRAQRADAILRRMQRCERLHQPHSGEGGDPLRHEPPLPDLKTYFSVLRLYAGESGPKELALRAESVAEEMVEKFAIRAKVVVWNQVFSCWAVSTDPEKCVHATSLLRKLKESTSISAEISRGSIGEDGRCDDAQEGGSSPLLDSSSYGHVFRACALSNEGDAQSRKLGAEVALRVWGEYKTSGLSMTSHAVTFLLRAVGNLPAGDRRGVQTVEDAMLRCRQDGVVSAHVMHQLGMAVNSLSLGSKVLKRIVGKDVAEGLEKGISGVSLLRKVPKKWKSNVQSKKQYGW